MGTGELNFYVLDHEATFEDLKQFSYPHQKIGVIAHIENEKGEILLQQRGSKAFDEKGLYEDIGGKVEKEDSSFKEAMIREIEEEAGQDFCFALSDSIGIYHCEKKEIHWIFLIYFVKYIEGPIKIMEPEKCMGYQFFSYQQAMNSKLVTESCKYLIKSIEENFGRYEKSPLKVLERYSHKNEKKKELRR